MNTPPTDKSDEEMIPIQRKALQGIKYELLRVLMGAPFDNDRWTWHLNRVNGALSVAPSADRAPLPVDVDTAYRKLIEAAREFYIGCFSGRLTLKEIDLARSGSVTAAVEEVMLPKVLAFLEAAEADRKRCEALNAPQSSDLAQLAPLDEHMARGSDLALARYILKNMLGWNCRDVVSDEERDIEWLAAMLAAVRKATPSADSPSKLAQVLAEARGSETYRQEVAALSASRSQEEPK